MSRHVDLYFFLSSSYSSVFFPPYAHTLQHITVTFGKYNFKKKKNLIPDRVLLASPHHCATTVERSVSSRDSLASFSARHHNHTNQSPFSSAPPIKSIFTLYTYFIFLNALYYTFFFRLHLTTPPLHHRAYRTCSRYYISSV